MDISKPGRVKALPFLDLRNMENHINKVFLLVAIR